MRYACAGGLVAAVCVGAVMSVPDRAPVVLAQGSACSMSGYSAAPGLSATAERDGISVTWAGEQGSDLRLSLAVDNGQPVVRELAIRKKGGQWATLGRNLTPEFDVTVGRRRMGFDQLMPFRERGVPIDKPLVEREKWNAFWDAPLEVPGRVPFNMPDADAINKVLDLPRKADEIKRATVSYRATGCDVKTNGASIEVSFPGLSLGVFSGRLQFTVYKGANLIRQEALASTNEPSVAYKYEAGLKGFSPATQRVRWRDTGGDWNKYEFGGAVNESFVPLRARNRIATVEGPGGSIAVFPPPHKFFFSRELEINLGYVWYRKDSDTSFAVGVRHGDHEEMFRPIGVQADWVAARERQAEAFVGGNFALYNAPPGTEQRMAVFYYLSPEQAPATQEAALRFTHNDQWKAIPGYVAMTTHYHAPFTMELKDRNSFDHQAEWIPAIRARGANIVMVSDFHADGHMTDPGPVRLDELKSFYKASARHSDKDFAILYLEEPHQWFGYHFNIFFPKPVYWIQSRKPGEPFVQNDPELGKVYRVGSREDLINLLKAENGLMWMAHQRTKISSGYPDAAKNESYIKTDWFMGGEYRPNVPTDLSQKEMCEWVCFDAMDSMNNWTARSGLLPKFLVAATDTYMKFPEDDVYPEEYVNYVKLSRVPAVAGGTGWTELSKALRDGQYFVTSGEVLIRSFDISGTGDKRTITADVEWTFPLDFVEVVWGDGQKIDRRIISARDGLAFGTKKFTIPFDAAGKDWVRVSAWDIAANGAFTQPIRLSQPARPTGGN